MRCDMYECEECACEMYAYEMYVSEIEDDGGGDGRGPTADAELKR